MPATMKEEKIAVLLTSMAPQAQEVVLAKLGPERSGRVRAQMQRIGSSGNSKELVGQVLRELGDLMQKANGGGGDRQGDKETRRQGDKETGRQGDKETRRQGEVRNVSQAFATAPPRPLAAAPRAYQQHVMEPETSEDVVESLRQMDVTRLAAALQGEQPRTVSLVLAALDGTKAGEVLKRLPSRIWVEVSLRLSQTADSGPEMLQHVARAVLNKSRALGEGPVKPSGGEARHRKMADMLRALSKPERLEILAGLRSQDSETASKIGELLYQFEDILLVDDRSMPALLAEIDMRSLAVAIQNTSEEIIEKVNNNLSKRARDTLAEEIEFLDTVTPAQIGQARRLLVDAMLRLDQTGELIIKEEMSDD